jgi:hypothetical protein
MKKLTSLVVLVLSITIGYSQSITDIAFKAASTAAPDVVSCNFIIHLSDSILIDKIEVDLGTNDGASNLIDFSFDFDVSSGLASGFTYFRIGNSVYVETGTIPEYPTYFGRVRLKKSNGQYTDYFSFTSN